MKDSYYSVISRFLFIAAGILCVVSVWDGIIGWFGYRLSWVPYEPGRLFEFSAILVIFVIALLLRQIRDVLRQN
jgi:hypothetical protein